MCVCVGGARDSLSLNGRSMLIGTLGAPVICQYHIMAALVGSRRAARSPRSWVRFGDGYCLAFVASMRGRPCAAAACSSAANILAASAASAGAAARLGLVLRCLARAAAAAGSPQLLGTPRRWGMSLRWRRAAGSAESHGFCCLYAARTALKLPRGRWWPWAATQALCGRDLDSTAKRCVRT